MTIKEQYQKYIELTKSIEDVKDKYTAKYGVEWDADVKADFYKEIEAIYAERAALEQEMLSKVENKAILLDDDKVIIDYMGGILEMELVNEN